MVQTLAAIVLACVIGLVVAWPLAIVMIATQPIIIVCFYMKKGFLKTMNVATLKAQEESSKVYVTFSLHVIIHVIGLT